MLHGLLFQFAVIDGDFTVSEAAETAGLPARPQSLHLLGGGLCDLGCDEG